MILEYPWHLSHDNINIPLRVFSQQIHNQSHFISTTAATVWILPKCAALSPDVNHTFNQFQALHSTKPFDLADILYGSDEIDNQIEAQHQY